MAAPRRPPIVSVPAFRSVLAGLLLAVLAGGGVGAPLVHEAMHAAERASALAEHDADGHRHGSDADGREHLDEDCPTRTPLADLACTLCHGLTAGLSVPGGSDPAPDPSAGAWPDGASWATAREGTAPTGRGPPAG